MIVKNKRLAGGLVIFLLITGMVLVARGFLNRLPVDDWRLGQTFGNAYFDIMDDHDDFIKVIEGLVSSGKLDSTPKTLIQVDYHSDLNRNNRHLDENYVTQGNWINVLVSKGIVNKIYWVLPDRTQTVDALKKAHWEGQTPWLKAFFKGGPSDQTFYVDKNTGRIYFDEMPSGDQYTKVEFHKLILKDLPDFRKESGQIILSIDADFFDGVDSLKVRGELDSFLHKLENAGVTPVFTGCARSRDFTGDYLPEIEKFCEEIGSASLGK